MRSELKYETLCRPCFTVITYILMLFFCSYVRSEAVVAIYICKKIDSRRIYCSLLHSKTSSDGHKSQGITFPSGMPIFLCCHDVKSLWKHQILLTYEKSWFKVSGKSNLQVFRIFPLWVKSIYIRILVCMPFERKSFELILCHLMC